MILLRGFSSIPDIPSNGIDISLNRQPSPVIRVPGLARPVGMEVLATGPLKSDEINVWRTPLTGNLLFFLHAKGADSAGEDGDFERKVRD